MRFRLNENHRTASAESITGDEMRTIYFALKEYRDNLVTTYAQVVKKVFDEDDYFTLDELDPTIYDEPNPANEDILHLKDTVALTAEKNCNEYEDLMFLHETLFKVNAMLFTIVCDTGGDSSRGQWLAWLDCI